MGAVQCRTDDNQHHNQQITTTNVSTNSRSSAQMNQSSNINDTDINDNKSNEININQIDPSETVSSVASTIILSTDPSETSSTDPLDTATGDSSNASPAHPTTTSSEATDIIEFENWKAAFMHVINQNNLTQDIDDAFVQTVSTAHKLKGRGIISDKLYRVLHNQLHTQQWSLALTNAVARLRPGASGKSHQVAFAKQFGMEAVQIEDEMKSILHKKGKVVLCESMIDNVVRGLHNFEGHLAFPAFHDQFKSRFSCDINKEELRKKYSALNCDDCAPNRHIPSDIHTNFTYIKGRMKVHQIDYIDVKKHFDKRIQKQLAKCGKHKILTWYDLDSMAMGHFAHDSENQREFIRDMTAIYNIIGYPDEARLDNGAAFIAKLSEEAMKSQGTSVRHGQARTPQHQGHVERWNRTQTPILKEVILSATDEQREDWPNCLLHIFTKKCYDKKLRKLGNITIFENVYGYPRDPKERKLFYKKQEKEGKAIAFALGLQHMSSEYMKFITHPLVDIQYKLNNQLIRLQYQLQRHSYNVEQMTTGREPVIIPNGQYGLELDKKGKFGKKKNKKVLIKRFLPTIKRYLIQTNWDESDAEPKHNTSSIFSTVAVDPTQTIPMPDHRQSPAMCLESYELDIESFSMHIFKEWRDVRGLRKSLKDKYKEIDDYKEIVLIAQKRIGLSIENITFASCYEMIYQSMHYLWAQYLSNAYSSYHSRNNICLNDDILNKYINLDAHIIIHYVINDNKFHDKVLGIVGNWKYDQLKNRDFVFKIWLSIISGAMHECSSCVLTTKCLSNSG